MKRPLILIAASVVLAKTVMVFAPAALAAFSTGPDQVSARISLAARITALGESFGPGVGISVRDVSTGWTTGYDSQRLAPQQSVSKMWVALSVFDAFDRGVLRPSDDVTITQSDLTLFHQPIRAMVKGDGYRTTVSELLERAMTQSDNTANDALLRKVGGPEAVRGTLARMGITNIRFGPGERLLQSRIAGITWQQAFSTGNKFYTARAGLPMQQRLASLEAYIADPIDGAAPNAITLAFARLARGELLSPRQTTNLLALMERSKTGAKRMKAGVDAEWQLAHKTGTGQQVGGLVAGFNDVGLLTAPDGRRYAVAVMIAKSARPIGQRQALIADVARAVMDHWRGTTTAATAMRPIPAQP
jgi:beta-lactamase class A